MTEKNRYSNGNEAVKRMKNILGDIWRQIALMPFYNETLEEMNGNYQKARDIAMAFGEDVNQYPRRIRWRTNRLHIIGDHI